MVLFDLLHISDDGKRMYLNFHINKAEYFKDLTLKSLTVIPADKVLETSPTVPSEDYVYRKLYEDGKTEDAMVLQPTDFNETFAKNDFSSDLFFVYVEVKGTPDSCTPCRLDEAITLGVTFDENLLYQEAMQYTKQLQQDCQVPVGFADFILRWNAFKASVETEHYIQAVKFWNMLFSSADSTTSITQTCGCHG